MADWNTICARMGKKTLRKMEIALGSANERGCSTQCRATKVVGEQIYCWYLNKSILSAHLSDLVARLEKKSTKTGSHFSPFIAEGMDT